MGYKPALDVPHYTAAASPSPSKEKADCDRARADDVPALHRGRLDMLELAFATAKGA